ncbi:MAG TPA: hypothetical protein PLE74_12485 [Candidatus Cloacimonadota bacterium]|nr:hypothetical protein [Candidatus Cloacimonadota bacterium]HPT73085.1 hypothetical protein [Candidatus Cloacimonadota bacterium]
MGTQQILLIVLSVIIVGVAVAVGISMFATQATNSNRQAIVAELQNFGAAAIQYYKTPSTLGGGGNGTPGFGADLTAAKAGVGIAMGFLPAGTLTDDTGTFTLGWTSASVITVTGVGTEKTKAGDLVSAKMTVTATDANPMATQILQ